MGVYYVVMSDKNDPKTVNMGVYYVVISDKNAQNSEKGQYPGYL